LDKEQANVAADTVLRDPLKEQAGRTAKVAKRRAFGGKWTGIGALAGLAIGSLAGHLIVGHMFPWSTVGISFGAGFGGFMDQHVWAKRSVGGP